MDRVTGRAFATRSEVAAQHGMACTSQPLATQVALDLLKQGGSAVDAAIAANAALGLMEPTGAGLGGDLFAIVWDAGTRKLHGLNASGRSPRSLTLEHFRQLGIQRIPPRGPLPVSVPGAVDGWFELHGRFGRLPMKTVLAPVIRYADEGFPVSEVIAWDMAKNMAILGEYPGFRETYSVDGIRAPRAGEVWRNPRLARTLDLLAEGGRDAFYRGVIAREIDAYLKAQGGFLSFEDLASHQGEWVDPVSVDYRGYDVWALPGNGQGIAVLQMLNILEGYDFSRIPFGSPRHVHLFTEAKKLVFEDRAKFYGDPAFVRVPVRELLSKTYAARRRALIDEDRASLRLEAGNPALEDGDTVYLTVADRDGTMVSLIQSNFRGMGSGMTPGLGFCLQDRGELFSLEEGQANTYAPGKRPFHTIIPGFITRGGEPFLSFGVMGGAFQPLGQVQIVMNILDFGMGIQEAGDAPRMAHEGSPDPTGAKGALPGTLQLESGFPYETVRELMEMGHRVGWTLADYGGYQGIRWDPGQEVFFGASESRKDGQAAGY
ncbi:MAG: gamma-glutamyltransferase [Holophaga sp.]|jgi:gamma-glutamyltranspeptidase/glutathione hydrolase